VATFYGLASASVDAVTLQVAVPAVGASAELARDVAFTCLADNVHEVKQAGVVLLHVCRKSVAGTPAAAAATVARAEASLDAGHVYDWATCDSLSSRVLTVCVQRDATQAPRIAAWAGAPNLWKRRAAAVAFVRLASKPQLGYGATILGVCDTAVRGEVGRERFVQLGVGWLLRELSVGAPDDALAFMRAHHGLLSREGLRYALEKTPAVDRAAMMAYAGPEGLEQAAGAAGTAAGGAGQGRARGNRPAAAGADSANVAAISATTTAAGNGSGWLPITPASAAASPSPSPQRSRGRAPAAPPPAAAAAAAAGGHAPIEKPRATGQKRRRSAAVSDSRP
jgi:3-methyladenine DNA glycosylase AlkD